MNNRRFSAALAAVLLAALCLATPAQAQAERERTLQLIQRLEGASDRLKRSTDAALDRSSLDNSRLEDQVNALIAEFEDAADALEDRAERNVATVSDLENVLTRALRLEMFMQANRLTPQAQSDWAQVRSALDELTRPFNVAWVWTVKDHPAMKNLSMRQVISRLEARADQFRDSFDDALDKGRADGTRFEDHMNDVVRTFEQSLDRLEDQARRSDKLETADVRIFLNNALAIEGYMRKYKMTPRAWLDWERVKANLDELAFANNVVWVWTITPATTTTAVVSKDPAASPAQGERVGMSGNAATGGAAVALARDVRRALLSDLPYYGVFDWIEFDVRPDNAVVLRGQVITPPDTKSRAEAVVKDVSGVSRVINQIEALPVSPNDDRLRRAVYHAIYGADSPLFRYGVGSRQSIHIIVKDGRATLKGVVDSETDKNLAFVRARSVSGLFAVENDLRVDGERRMMAR